MTREPKGVNEIVKAKFDFSDEADGIAITGSVITVTVTKGADAAADAMKYNAATNNADNVLQLIRNGVVNNFYRITCLAIFADGRKLERHYDIEVVA